MPAEPISADTAVTLLLVRPPALGSATQALQQHMARMSADQLKAQLLSTVLPTVYKTVSRPPGALAMPALTLCTAQSSAVPPPMATQGSSRLGAGQSASPSCSSSHLPPPGLRSNSRRLMS